MKLSNKFDCDEIYFTIYLDTLTLGQKIKRLGLSMVKKMLLKLNVAVERRIPKKEKHEYEVKSPPGTFTIEQCSKAVNSDEEHNHILGYIGSFSVDKDELINNLFGIDGDYYIIANDSFELANDSFELLNDCFELSPEVEEADIETFYGELKDPYACYAGALINGLDSVYGEDYVKDSVDEMMQNIIACEFDGMDLYDIEDDD